jgi:hypothetical protein
MSFKISIRPQPFRGLLELTEKAGQVKVKKPPPKGSCFYRLVDPGAALVAVEGVDCTRLSLKQVLSCIKEEMTRTRTFVFHQRLDSTSPTGPRKISRKRSFEWIRKSSGFKGQSLGLVMEESVKSKAMGVNIKEVRPHSAFFGEIAAGSRLRFVAGLDTTRMRLREIEAIVRDDLGNCYEAVACVQGPVSYTSRGVQFVSAALELDLFAFPIGALGLVFEETVADEARGVVVKDVQSWSSFWGKVQPGAELMSVGGRDCSCLSLDEVLHAIMEGE